MNHQRHNTEPFDLNNHFAHSIHYPYHTDRRTIESFNGDELLDNLQAYKEIETIRESAPTLNLRMQKRDSRNSVQQKLHAARQMLQN